MELKKGFYFTIDSIIAGSIIIVLISLINPFYATERPSVHPGYLSQDLATVLGTITVREINNGYIKSLINDGTISNLDNTVLEQIGEFWANNQMDLANKTAANVTGPWVSNITGVGVWINNESIYTNGIQAKDTLVSSKRIMSGIKKGQAPNLPSRRYPPALWGPAIAEVRVWE